MTSPQVDEDGALQPALQLLGDAIHRLCGPQSQFMDGKLLWASSRYMQLRDATAGEQSNSGGGSGGKSRPPGWLDALSMLKEIDETVACWSPQLNGVPVTIGRLNTLRDKKWRPMDVRQIEQIANAVALWADEIDALLDPPRRWSLPSPCPSCNTSIVYRRDAAGEVVRQPALQIGVDGCVCARCHTTWGPQLFTHLARVLGYEMPAGLLE